MAGQIRLTNESYEAYANNKELAEKLRQRRFEAVDVKKIAKDFGGRVKFFSVLTCIPVLIWAAFGIFWLVAGDNVNTILNSLSTDTALIGMGVLFGSLILGILFVGNLVMNQMVVSGAKAGYPELFTKS